MSGITTPPPRALRRPTTPTCGGGGGGGGGGETSSAVASHVPAPSRGESSSIVSGPAYVWCLSCCHRFCPATALGWDGACAKRGQLAQRLDDDQVFVL